MLPITLLQETLHHTPTSKECNSFFVENIGIFSAEYSAHFSNNTSSNINPCFTNKWTLLSESLNSFLQCNNAEYYYLCWFNWRTLWRKNTTIMSPRGSCSCTTTPRLTGHLQPRRNWPTWASNVLITHPILQIWPRRTTTCSLDWKNNWKVAIFRHTRRSLLSRRPGWTDNLLIYFFFELLAKVTTMG